MLHTRRYTTFKDNASAGIRGNSVATAFGRSDANISPMILKLFEELKASVHPLVRRVNFSLVNICCPDSRRSIGYMESPPAEILRPYTGLAFTFSLTSRPNVKKLKEYDSVPTAQRTVYWGKDFLKTTDYMTICVPKNEIESGLPYRMPKDLEYIYDVIGMVTKSFVFDSSFYRDDGFSNFVGRNTDVLAGIYLNMTPKTLLQGSAFNTWIHNKDMWLRADNVFCRQHFYREFGHYFATQIFEWVAAKELTHDANEYVYGQNDWGFVSYIERGIRDLRRYINKEDVNTPELEAVIHLLYLLDEYSIPQSGDRNYWVYLRDFKRTPAQLLDANLAARELIRQTEYLNEVAEKLI